MSATAASFGDGVSLMRRILVAVLFAGAFVWLGAALGEARLLVIGAAMLSFGLIIAGLWIGDLRAAVLMGAIIAASYNRQYYSFDDIIGNFASRGLYWVPADFFYFVLIIIVVLSATAKPTRRAQPRRPRLAVALLAIFILWMFFSALAADMIAPALFEVLRLLKFLCILLLLRDVLTPVRAGAAMTALIVVIALQFVVGALEVALGTGGSGLSQMAEQEGELARRAHGTLGHPNFLAPFLLTVAPGFLALGLVRSQPLLRLIALAAGAAGCLTIILTQSRAPVAALLLILAALGAHMALRGRFGPGRLVGVGAALALVAGLAALPIADRILDRVSGDLADSVSFRADYNDAAIAMWLEAPIMGVGPNHFTAHLERFHPIYAQINDEIEEHRIEASFRAAAPVHNLYLLVLAETGAVGLCLFLVFLAAVARDLLRASAVASWEPFPLFFLGVFWGYLGVLFQQFFDYSLWWDHHLNLLVVLVALANFAQSQHEETGR